MSSICVAEAKAFLRGQTRILTTVTDYACRLRRLVADCDLATSASILLRDIFVIGVSEQAEAFERGKNERASSAAINMTQMSRNSTVESADRYQSKSTDRGQKQSNEKRDAANANFR